MENNTEDLTEQIIFILLNLVFFAMLIYFVINSSSGAFVSEQFYAKRIGLLIDSAKPGTAISLDVTDAYNIAKKNELNVNSVFRIDKDKIIVQLSSSRVYAYQFFNNVDVEIPESAYSSYQLNGEKKMMLNLFIKSKDDIAK